MRTHFGKLRAPAAAVAAAALVVLGAGPAAASDHTDPIQTLLGQLDHSTHSHGVRGAVPAPSDDSDLPGHETEDPTPPDHGGASVAKVKVAGNDLANLGSNKATTRDDDGTSADSTLLALGGQEILGAHADSTGKGEDHSGDWLAPLCQNSGGQVCLRFLFSDAYASDNGQTSYSQSRNGVASTCLGGSSTDPDADCTGPVAAGVATSEGESGRDQSSGRTTASSQADLFSLCLRQPDATTTDCALGLGVLHSDGRADSGGDKPSAARDSYLADLTANGEDQGRVDQPQSLSIQPDCAAPSLECTYLNQGETYLGGQVAGHAQDALDASVLPGTPLEADANVVRSETLVHNNGGETASPAARAPEVLGKQAGRGNPGSGTGGLGGVLPNTGGVWSGLLAGGLAAVGLGALLMAWSRRRALALR
jgi:LPXTG-motif cell wall-anchored protein